MSVETVVSALEYESFIGEYREELDAIEREGAA